MKKIGVLYLNAEHFESEAAQTIGTPIIGPDMKQRILNRRRVDGRLTLLGKELKRQTIAYFKEKFGIDVILCWSRNAGCSMCPCSPGFVIKSNSASYYGRLEYEVGPRGFRRTFSRAFNVWITDGKLDPHVPEHLPFAIPDILVGTA